ncbi:hypothetical protein CYMTET_17274 [Cymbomonas tetramitiformis]|uniref:Uncharacterized protein n=1 Tax=Cymbomonas tetramitiformis TaxID=36881 RepID=A0AAE0L747_9CHLO|nr:hypothetical protein CYMTET_17274 [Cymbomonas tetramitiformis]
MGITEEQLYSFDKGQKKLSLSSSNSTISSIRSSIIDKNFDNYLKTPGLRAPSSVGSLRSSFAGSSEHEGRPFSNCQTRTPELTDTPVLDPTPKSPSMLARKALPPKNKDEIGVSRGNIGYDLVNMPAAGGEKRRWQTRDPVKDALVRSERNYSGDMAELLHPPLAVQCRPHQLSKFNTYTTNYGIEHLGKYDGSLQFEVDQRGTRLARSHNRPGAKGQNKHSALPENAVGGGPAIRAQKVELLKRAESMLYPKTTNRLGVRSPQ